VSNYNEDVIKLSAKLGKALKYTGPAMVEFKQDPADNVYKYIEINPRLGMCNFFDTSCGINNAFSTYQLATQQPLPAAKAMKNGVMFVSFYEDLFSRLRDNETLGAILKEYFSNFISKKHIFIYFVWWDPKPAASLLYRQIKGFVSSKFKRKLS
jgi:predicted ATP-grasp superfamily ATP-dependent carboligase